MKDDSALEILLDINADQASSLSEKLIRNCYRIQKEHQFDSDRGKTVSLIRKLVEDVVDEEIESQSAAGEEQS